MDEAGRQLLRRELLHVLKSLTPREERVITLRFGLEDGRARTLEELGKEFNVTRERVRQIEAKALRKLRHPSRAKLLRDYLYSCARKCDFCTSLPQKRDRRTKCCAAVSS